APARVAPGAAWRRRARRGGSGGGILAAEAPRVRWPRGASPGRRATGSVSGLAANTAPRSAWKVSRCRPPAVGSVPPPRRAKGSPRPPDAPRRGIGPRPAWTAWAWQA
ncbi:unnamed protein product, partial [Prorocentrum cordatum]